MNLDWMARPGGQLLGCYILACVVLFFSHPNADTLDKLLFLIIGAILRDMQDSRNSQSPHITNSPGATVNAVDSIPNEQKESN